MTYKNSKINIPKNGDPYITSKILNISLNKNIGKKKSVSKLNYITSKFLKPKL